MKRQQRSKFATKGDTDHMEVSTRHSASPSRRHAKRRDSFCDLSRQEKGFDIKRCFVLSELSPIR